MDDAAQESEERFAEIIRVGNRAVREAQSLNRRLGIANWYLVGGRLVSDRPSGDAAEKPVGEGDEPH